MAASSPRHSTIALRTLLSSVKGATEHSSTNAPLIERMILTRRANYDDLTLDILLTPLIGPKVECIVKIDIGQKRRGHGSLRSAHLSWYKVSIIHDARLYPLADQAKNAAVANSVFHKTSQPFVADRIEESGNVGVPNPIRLRRGYPHR